MPRVDRCVCEKVTFAEILRLAREERLANAEAVAARTGCGTHCGWCVAYVRRALATGETTFDSLLPKETLDSPEKTLDPTRPGE